MKRSLISRPHQAGKEVDGGKMEVRNVNRIPSGQQNMSGLESVVKINSSQDNNNIAVTQL